GYERALTLSTWSAVDDNDVSRPDSPSFIAVMRSVLTRSDSLSSPVSNDPSPSYIVRAAFKSGGAWRGRGARRFESFSSPANAVSSPAAVFAAGWATRV